MKKRKTCKNGCTSLKGNTISPAFQTTCKSEIRKTRRTVTRKSIAAEQVRVEHIRHSDDLQTVLSFIMICLDAFIPLPIIHYTTNHINLHALILTVVSAQLTPQKEARIFSTSTKTSLISCSPFML